MFITVLIHNEDGAWWAESPDLPGYSAAADTREELETLVFEGVKAFLGGTQNMTIVLRTTDQPVAAGIGGAVVTGAISITHVAVPYTTSTGLDAASLRPPQVSNAAVKTTPELAQTA